MRKFPEWDPPGDGGGMQGRGGRDDAGATSAREGLGERQMTL